jgi:hypothetical protein
VFLSGPVASVLTNLGGFSAHLTATITANGETRAKSGELLGREGRLLYQPALLIKGKRARAEGGLFFVVNENTHSGYLLSEALQGYAPIHVAADAAGPTVNSIPRDGQQEDIDGHPSHRCEVTVPLTNGHSGRLTVWQADDLRHFPLRIDWVRDSDQMTLDFSNIRLEYPQQELFRPPDGFTAYADPVALMNELMIRDASLTKQTQSGEFDEPRDVRSSNWHGGAPSP